jgi:hypothetical protein
MAMNKNLKKTDSSKWNNPVKDMMKMRRAILAEDSSQSIKEEDHRV